MKKLKVYLLLVGLIYANVCFAQSGWFWQNPKPSGSKLISIKFIDVNTGYIITDKGGVLKTTNKGLNWLYFYTGTDARLYSQSFINVNSGFAVGENGTILKTINGGLNWAWLNSPISSSLKSIFFINNNTGWICGDSGKILITTNNGNLWLQQNSGLKLGLLSIFFIDESTGWCTTHGNIILKTTNAGINWNSDTISYFNSFINDILFVNFNTGFAIGHYNIGMFGAYRVIKTTDGGSNWFTPSTISTSDLYDIFFIDDMTGWTVGNNSKFKTTDGGYSWSNQSLVGFGMNSVDFIDQNTGWVAGDNGNILTTSNAGVNWVNSTSWFSNKQIMDIAFINENTGLVGNSYGEIFETNDWGLNWLLKYNFNILVLQDIDFINDKGWAVFNGGGGRVFYTSNRGSSWANISIGNPHFPQTEPLCLKFINDQTGYIGCSYYPCSGCADGGVIYKTTNNGNNWLLAYSTYNPSFDNGFQSVFFINSQTGWLAGGHEDRGIIVKTTNEGNSWSTYYTDSNTPNDFKDIFFINNETGWVCGRGGICKTTNSGVSWNVQLLNASTNIFSSIFFVNPDTGWSVDRNGNSFKTTNGGTNWFLQYNPTRNSLTTVYFLNQSTGFIIGNNGTMLKTTDGGGQLYPLGLNTISEGTPNNFLLKQNFPNPFNPQTKIKFDIPASVESQKTNVRLVIYDLLGREVATLVNEELSPGTYEADWDASSFSSGVYFYKIISGEFVETKKMVLMK